MYQPGGTSSESSNPGGTSVSEFGSGLGFDSHESGLEPAAGQECGVDTKAGGALKELGNKAGEIRDRARETVQSVAERAREEAGAVFQRVKDQSQTALNQGKHRAADGMSHFALAVREAADRLHEDGDHNIAGYAEDISNQVERAARYIQERDIGTLLSDLGSTVRRRPGLFFAGMFIGGLVAARFIKASRKSRDSESESAPEPEWSGAYSQPGGSASSAPSEWSGDYGGTGATAAPVSRPGYESGAPLPGSGCGLPADRNSSEF